VAEKAEEAAAVGGETAQQFREMVLRWAAARRAGQGAAIRFAPDNAPLSPAVD
jgi:hypothetical protein